MPSLCPRTGLASTTSPAQTGPRIQKERVELMETPQHADEHPAGGAGKELVRRLVEEGVNQGRLAIVDEVLAATFPPLSNTESGPEGIKRLLLMYRAAIPDARWFIEQQVAEGDLVVTFFVAQGTQHGPLWGLPATGQRMAVSGVLLSRCHDGWIVEQRLRLDLLSLLQQLGVMPDVGLDEAVLVARLLRTSSFWMSGGKGERTERDGGLSGAAGGRE